MTQQCVKDKRREGSDHILFSRILAQTLAMCWHLEYIKKAEVLYMCVQDTEGNGQKSWSRNRSNLLDLSNPNQLNLLDKRAFMHPLQKKHLL